MNKAKRKPLHPRTVGSTPLPASGYTRTWDTVERGLHVVTTAKGARVFRVRYRLADNRRVDYLIGNVKDIGLTKAREKAHDLTEEARVAKEGEHPQAVKIRERGRVDLTFGALADQCLASLALRPSTLMNWTGIHKNHLRPRFGRISAADIDRRMIREFTEKMGKATPVQAARAFEVMRRVYAWGVETERLRGTPFVNLRKPPKVQEADSLERDRYLSRAEVHAVFVALKHERSKAGGFDHYVRLLFETCLRRDEMLKSSWKEIDLDAGFFTVATLRFKSKRPHQVPLTKAAVAALTAIKEQTHAKAELAAIRSAMATADEHQREILDHEERTLLARMKAVAASPWVFPGPVASKARTSVQRAFERLRRRAGFVDWTVHDVRRTVSNGLAQLGTAPHVKEAILGHAPDKLARTYSNHVPLLEMRAALEKWSQELQRIIDTAPSVHQFKSQASA